MTTTHPLVTTYFQEYTLLTPLVTISPHHYCQRENSPYKHLLLSAKQKQYIIGHIQKFTQIQLLEIIYVLVDASQI